jgi:hypothetical protein
LPDNISCSESSGEKMNCIIDIALHLFQSYVIRNIHVNQKGIDNEWGISGPYISLSC